MAMWLIGGGALVGAWAMLSVVGGELTRRTQDLQEQYRRVRPIDPEATHK